MLEGLNAIDWRSLRHAYGSAADVPGLIRDLASPAPDVREHALSELHGNIWHQGTVYEATAYAAPFFIELLRHDSVADKAELLWLLEALATGSPYISVHDRSGSLTEQSDPLRLRQQLEQELEWVRRAHDTVADGIDVYLELLGREDSVVRLAATHLLGHLGEHAPRVIPRLRGMLEAEDDSGMTVALLLSLSQLVRDDPEARKLFAEFAAGDKDDVVAIAGAIALTRLARQQTPSEAVNTLAAALANTGLMLQEGSGIVWGEEGLEELLLDCVRLLGPESSRLVIQALLEALAQSDNGEAFLLATVLMEVGFPDQGGVEKDTAANLSVDQWAILAALVEHAPDRLGTLAGQLGWLGLPRTPKELRALLEREASLLTTTIGRSSQTSPPRAGSKSAP